MGGAKLFSKDAGWYIDNLDQIAAFYKWIATVEVDLPNQLAMFLKIGR